MKINNTILRITLFLFVIHLGSCQKYLDTKSNQTLSTPESIKDLQALLDNAKFYKRGASNLALTGSDEYYVDYADWETLDEVRKNGYTWDAALDNVGDWYALYENVLYANVILDNWDKITNGSPGKQANEIKGGALAQRAQCFYQLLQLYASQYDVETASTDLGIVLRLEADFNKASQRATVKRSYDQVIQDLNEAISLLPPTTLYKTRPNKPAVYALLARCYLQTGEYAKAKEAADNCLQLYDYLIDYNNVSEVDTSSIEPFINKGVKNPEIIWYFDDESSLNAYSSVAKVDSAIQKSYEADDIRRSAFFQENPDGSYMFKGSYNGMTLFVGLGTAEVYLIRAECNARLGNINEAMQALNTLLIKRFKTGQFTPITSSDPELLLKKILDERKKEMFFRGMRWADLKRLNKEPSKAIAIQRNLNATLFTLSPNDPRYTLLIPQEVMRYSNLQQNPR